MNNVGDKIASMATPIARALRLPCIDPETRELRPESGCAQRREMLNQGRYADAFFNVFWPNHKERNEDTQKMQFIITVAVEAESVEEALQKKNEGKTLSVNPRPQPPAGTRPPGVAASLTHK